MKRETAVIIGAGPAGLTAALELAIRTKIRPVVFEMSSEIGGISRTVRFEGNRMDIGGHRFFSKSSRVMDWWLARFPLQRLPTGFPAPTSINIDRYQHLSAPDPDEVDRVMLLRSRQSRIYHLRRFFDYPLRLTPETLLKLGLWRTTRITASYLRSLLMPIRHEKTLEHFFVNRFGRELFETFFRDYTEKVWGVPCSEISADWGAQRIKGLSISRAISHFFKRIASDYMGITSEKVETSLIEQFLYPKLGPGQLWEYVAEEVSQHGGVVHSGQRVVGLDIEGERITSVRVRDVGTGRTKRVRSDYVMSTMPVCDLIEALGKHVPGEVSEVASGLRYRDFITVGLLVSRLKLRSDNSAEPSTQIEDNWIYIQEPDVKLGRIQIFNNWSEYMVTTPGTVCLGLEYFCDVNDDLWSMSDGQIAQLAIKELVSIDIIDANAVIRTIVVRVPKAYPAYFGTYRHFGIVQSYTDRFKNLFMIGRNGMHRYNNQDHSMLSAMIAVDNIIAGLETKDNIWKVNSEGEYHERQEQRVDKLVVLDNLIRAYRDE